MDESLGKIIGMAMAYGVSSLGLLLAYYNYRKRIVKAERIFTTGALAIIGGIVLAVGIAVVLALSLMKAPETQPVKETAAVEKVAAPEKIAIAKTESPDQGTPIIGIVVPGIIFLFSFWVTWMLYKHFTKQLDATESSAEEKG